MEPYTESGTGKCIIEFFEKHYRMKGDKIMAQMTEGQMGSIHTILFRIHSD